MKKRWEDLKEMSVNDYLAAIKAKEEELLLKAREGEAALKAKKDADW